MRNEGRSIGEVAARTGLTERTLRYYEELGLVSPARDGGGRRRYDQVSLDRLYRVRLQRDLGTPLARVSPDDADVLTLTGDHLAGLDAEIAALARRRERVRAVQDRLMRGTDPAPTELLDLLAGLGADETVPTRRLTLLVYRDLSAAHEHLVEVLGFGAGPVTRDDDGRVVHAEVHVGDGVVWLHPELTTARLASPATVGSASACLAVEVDDVEAHHARLVAAGARIDYAPTDMPYGVREYGVRDLEDHLWSFQQPLPESDARSEET
ncbi:MerR family transcriptional regulator [Nocardioides nanhaiensis]|uniref:MerR family transcriptional regulator n=1 Tax=Nocardioides nanhaiensis TaxID=1476871 RepID=A0ABP8W6V3_9ACTN